MPVLTDLAEEAAALREEGITVSVLATGEGSAAELEEVAEAGGGRFYPGRNLEEIPQIMQQEATIASRDFVNEGEFLPDDHVVRRGRGAASTTPPLAGYVATTAKPQAADAACASAPTRTRCWSRGTSAWAGHVVDSDGGDRWAAAVGVVGRLRRLLVRRGQGHLPRAATARAG